MGFWQRTRSVGQFASSRVGKGLTWFARLPGALLLLLLAAVVLSSYLGVAGWFSVSQGKLVAGWATVVWASLAVFVVLPRLQARSISEGKERFDAENAARQTLLQLGGGLLLVGGAWVTWAQLAEQQKANLATAKAAEENLRLSRETLLSERLARAHEDLESDQPRKRIAAVYTLERLSHEPQEGWPILEVLTSSIRERSPWSDRSIHDKSLEGFRAPEYPAANEKLPPHDLQAALVVLGRNMWDSPIFEEESHRAYPRFWLNLSGTDLRGADMVHFQKPSSGSREPGRRPRVNLRGAHLDRALLTGANLGRANLAQSCLRGAWLRYANLSLADLTDADLTSVHLVFATLDRANLEDTIMRGADLSDVAALDAGFYGTDLEGAVLESANLTGARITGGARLVRANLEGAVLVGVQAAGADFTGANLDKADLRGAIFETQREAARGLTREQLRTAITDSTTVLPK